MEQSMHDSLLVLTVVVTEGDSVPCGTLRTVVFGFKLAFDDWW
jgi:hypothetical protein